MVTKRRIITRIAAVSVATVIAAGLTACSSSDSGDSSSSDKNIRIDMNSGLVPQFESYAKKFESTHKGYKVTVNAVPDKQSDYIQQLVTQGLSKSLPDILFNYDTLNQTLVANHLLYDIKPWLDEGRDGLKGSTFLPNFLGQYAVGDQITGIPVSADSGVVTINKTLFEKYGVPVPAADWTYDEMYDSAKAITEKSGASVYGIQAPIGDGSALFTFYPVLKAYGSNLYDPKTKKFIFADAGGIKAWTQLLAPYTEKFGLAYSAKPSTTAFPSGQVAMAVSSTAGVAGLRDTVKDDWDIRPMPTLDGASTTGGGSYSLSISAKSENKEGAFKFLAWFYSTDGGMAAAAADGIIPATADGIKSGAWLKDANPVPASFVETVQTSVPKAVLPNTIPDDVQPKVVPALQTALQEVVLKGESIEKAYTAAQDQLNGLLK